MSDWTKTHREALELMARVAHADPEDREDAHPFLSETIDAALAEIDRLHHERDMLMRAIQMLLKTLDDDRLDA